MDMVEKEFALFSSGLADDRQIIDFSSTYLEGEKAEFASYGYSRDKRSDKMQINFGIAAGINGIPTALTIQRENIHEKMKQMYDLGCNGVF